ncbi:MULTISPECIES: peptidoglycan D,D-transpeptidase FtsI family protein [Kordiimonas]|uniref:Cell division protein FtsI (Penicillin-binding protein 3) n=1 Tax=Kordiimonas lacus TaxID=637679 RepID=A0A1G7DKQ6_9PROT|nr:MULTISPECIES: penicillin-binding protein 2 [Kordiimonas]SDE52154.1 cell division protein FtsI (penicillin-binding protein 3) [Kordiimonas lacus]
MSATTAYQRLSLEGERKSALDVARNRLMVAVLLFFAAFAVMVIRTVELGLSTPETKQVAERQIVIPPVKVARADILDRNGEVLATNLETSSLYANPSEIKNPADVAARLVAVLPDLSLSEVEEKLSSDRKFVWLKRKLSPREKWEVNALGVPAFQFQREEERVYPHGRLAAHALGYVDVDGNGLGGVEYFFNDRLNDAGRTDEPIKLALDIRVQYALTDELEAAMSAHRAIGAAGIVMDVNSGEVIALASLPDYDPNDIRGVASQQRFNRATQGVYELGSTFKTFTFAAALDQGIATLEDGYDATKPLRIARFTIRDDHPKARYMSLPEIFAYSSNIGTAQMALDIGAERQQKFLRDLGFLDTTNLELAEVGSPIYPATWRKSSTMTISYGHGIAVSPVQLVNGIAAMVNGGRLIPATLTHNDDNWRQGQQVISQNTSRKIRQLLRLAVTKGTGGRSEAVGYRVGGKTGTAEKAVAGGYDRKALISSFVGVFPMDDPQYVVFALLDEPRGTKETFGYRSGGWVAAPVVKNVILRSAPLLGVAPKREDEGLYQQVALMIEED